MKSNTYKEYIAPVVVLVAICLIVTAALAVVYGISNPIIEANDAKAADEARAQLLSAADSFTKVDGDLEVLEEGKVYVQECYTADNGTGMVCTVRTSSFGGELIMMVGIDSDGAVTGVKISSHADTPGVGTRNWDSENMATAWDGLTELASTNVKDSANGISYISGASVTGAALHKGVYAALQQYAALQ